MMRAPGLSNCHGDAKDVPQAWCWRLCKERGHCVCMCAMHDVVGMLLAVLT
jgi:hypothetical protein